MKNIGQFMKQAQQMQEKMAEMQNRLSDVEITGESGGGMVKVTINGKNLMRKIEIDASLLNASEKDMLEDLIVAATNDAHTKVEQKMAEEMSGLTGGLNLPAGFKLPF